MNIIKNHILKSINSGPSNYLGYGFNSGFGGAKFPEGISGDGSPTLYNNFRLRANGRNAYQDSTHANTIAKRTADLIADVGLKFFSSPDWTRLGISRERAKEIGDDITKAYHNYCLSKKQHRSGIMNLYQAQRLYQIANKRDGDQFIRFYYSKDRSLISSLQFSFIDANQIIGDSVTSGGIPYEHKDGINRNAKGEEVSYDIYVVKKDGTIKTENIPRVGEKSKRTFMLHCFAPEFAGQKRGLSSLGTSAQDFQNIEDFIQAHTQKAINESNIFMYAENQLQTPSNPIRDQALPSGAGIPIAGVDPNSNVQRTPSELVVSRPVVASSKPGGMAFFNLTQGDKLKPFPNTTPSAGFDVFLDSYVSYLAAKNSIPKSILKMEFGQSYSASRGELLLYWKTVNVERAEMVSDFLNPNFEMFLSEEIAAGRLSLPGFSDPRMKMAWMGGTWYGSSIPSIDPLKEANANQLNLEMNATTLEKVTRNLDGSTSDSNITENQKTFPEMAIPYWEKQDNSNLITED